MSDKRMLCLNCMDGRTQLPVITWIKENHGADYVDMLTEAGMDGYLAELTNDIDAIKKKVMISLDKNNASKIFVVGHHDCKGNSVDDTTHKEHIGQAVTRLTQMFSDIDIIGLWVNEQFEVKELS